MWTQVAKRSTVDPPMSVVCEVYCRCEYSQPISVTDFVSGNSRHDYCKKCSGWAKMETPQFVYAQQDPADPASFITREDFEALGFTGDPRALLAPPPVQHHPVRWLRTRTAALGRHVGNDLVAPFRALNRWGQRKADPAIWLLVALGFICASFLVFCFVSIATTGNAKVKNQTHQQQTQEKQQQDLLNKVKKGLSGPPGPDGSNIADIKVKDGVIYVTYGNGHTVVVGKVQGR